MTPEHAAAFQLGLDNARNDKEPDAGYRFGGDKVERALIVAGYKAGLVERGVVPFPVLFYRGSKAQYWITGPEPLFQARPLQGTLAPAAGHGYPDLRSLFRLKNEPGV